MRLLNRGWPSWILPAVLIAVLVSACNLPVQEPAAQTNPPVVPSPRPVTAPQVTATLPPTPPPASTPLPSPTSVPLPPVTVETLPVASNYLGSGRLLSIYLPPSYASQPLRKYKVLYANDGQDLAVIGIEQILRGYAGLHLLDELIVVAVPASADRENEYGTGSILNNFNQGASALAYANFLVKEVLPLVNSRYRVLTGPENTGIMGWSLGGLSAFYTAWTHPELFGIVGAFSGSFWWSTSGNSLQELLDGRVVQKLVRESVNPPHLRMWFSAGTAEFDLDRDKNGVIDMVQDTTDLLAELSKKGYQDGVDYLYVQVEGGTHDLAIWVKILPDFLRWAFPPP